MFSIFLQGHEVCYWCSWPQQVKGAKGILPAVQEPKVGQIILSSSDIVLKHYRAPRGHEILMFVCPKETPNNAVTPKSSLVLFALIDPNNEYNGSFVQNSIV